MEDAVETVERQVLVGEVEPGDLEGGRVLFLQRRVVVVGERIDCDDLVTAGDERLRQMRSDEPGRPRDEVSHSVGASGLSVPSPFCVRLRPEKKRVITMPSRKSPSRGSGCSPRASASGSSG